MPLGAMTALSWCKQVSFGGNPGSSRPPLSKLKQCYGIVSEGLGLG